MGGARIIYLSSGALPSLTRDLGWGLLVNDTTTAVGLCLLSSLAGLDGRNIPATPSPRSV